MVVSCGELDPRIELLFISSVTLDNTDIITKLVTYSIPRHTHFCCHLGLGFALLFERLCRFDLSPSRVRRPAFQTGGWLLLCGTSKAELRDVAKFQWRVLPTQHRHTSEK